MSEQPSPQEEPSFGVTITSRLQHAALLEAVEKMGGQKQLGDYLGVSHSTVSAWLNLRGMPSLTGGKGRGMCYRKRWPEIERKLCELTGQRMEDLFPGFVRLSGFLQKSKVRRETRLIPAGLLLNSVADHRALPPPAADSNLDELREKLNELLKTRPQRERTVLELRYGLNGHEQHSLNDVARILKLTRERVRQIEIRALDRLRNRANLPDMDWYRQDEMNQEPCPTCRQLTGQFLSCACGAKGCHCCFQVGRCPVCDAKMRAQQ